MRLTIDFYPIGNLLGYERGIEECAKAGFDGIDVGFFDLKSNSPFSGDDYKQVCRNYLDIAKKNNIAFTQAHAPFGSPYSRYSAESIPHFPRMFECCAELGIKTVVIHPIQDGPFKQKSEELLLRSVEFYKGLVPMAREYGVKMATENMWQRDENKKIIDDICASPEQLCRCVDMVDSEWLVACLDIGHVVLCGREPADFIRTLGRDRLGALHVHDNDKVSDQHVLPFTGKIDWLSTCSALAEIGYKGDFTFEILKSTGAVPAELCPDILKYSERVGRYLISQIK